MKSDPTYRPTSSAETAQLLAYVYGKLPTLKKKVIEETVQANPSYEIALRGIRKLKRIHGFKTQEEHKGFLANRHTLLLENFAVKEAIKKIPLSHKLENVLKAGLKKLIPLFRIPACLTNGKLYSALSFKPEVLVSEMHLPGHTQQTFVACYQNDQYEKVIQVLNPLKPDPIFFEQYQFLMGFCHLQLNHSDKAITQFTQLARKETSNWSMMASWHLGLAYLRADRLDAALESFQILLGRKKLKNAHQKRFYNRTRSMIWRIHVRQLLRSFYRYINE